MTEKTHVQTRTFKKGEILLEEGKSGDPIYLIKKGKVEIRKGVRGETPRTLGTLGPGDVVGEMAMFGDQTHIATAVALEETVAVAMSREEFQRRLHAMDPIVMATVMVMASRARKLADMLMGKAGSVNWHDWKRKG